ncbi:MAG TPA: class I SAM-dependent methyltransferase [Polyangiales bacterium]|nr:class I SAM-dependent methyltransferase [Polyangiales bacterium]
MITDHRSRMYARYRSLMGRDASVPVALGDSSRRPFYDRLVRAYLPKDKSAAVLELACGDGGLLRCLAAHGYGDALGVDLSPEQVARARAAGTTRVEQADVFTALERLPESSKDVVIAIDLLEHLDKEEVMKLLDEVHRVLRPGGRLVMHTVNAESPFFGRVRYGDFTHRNAFTKLSIAQVCLAAQFARTECHEDPPTVHGLKSAVRWGLWQATRTVLRTALVAETGSLENPILSQNLLAVAFK